jgi:hypothetical protein
MRASSSTPPRVASNLLSVRGGLRPRDSSRLKVRVKHRLFALILLALLGPLCGVTYAAVEVELSPSSPSPKPVGTTVTWTASASDTEPGTLDYQFSVLTPTAGFTVVRDFSPSNSFEWTPSEREGEYQIRVIARNVSTRQTAQRTAAYGVSSRVVGGVHVVSNTAHPLVALYSAPACSGDGMRIKFWPSADPDAAQATAWKPCPSGVSVNFYVAGMRANTEYSMRPETKSAGSPPTMSGPTLLFTTGSLPVGIFPAYTVPDAPGGAARGLLLQTFISQSLRPAATDLGGDVLWYYDEQTRYVTRPLPGGTMLVLRDSLTPLDEFREIDLAGNTLRETNIYRVSEQLVAAGGHAITSFHHEAARLPDGKTLILCTNERVLTGVQSEGTDYVIGDVIVVLDENLQVVWSWDAFDHMDVTRKAIGDFKCRNQPACVTSSPGLANDWLHSNSVSYVPSDGNLIVSMRHQDWVVKIAYEDGGGAGEVVWRLGKDGDFTLSSDDPYPWFSYQHDAEFDDADAPGRISIFDNGNNRQALPGPVSKNSRGQVYDLDEVNRTATLRLNADLGGYSFALGSAQLLADGNYHFNSGWLPGDLSQSIGVQAGGAADFRLQSNTTTYRSFRMRDLYTPDISGPSYARDTQAISFAPLGDKTYGDAPLTLSATSTSGLPVAFRVVSGPATVSGNTLTIEGAGEVLVEAGQGGNEYYDAAEGVGRSFKVGKAGATLALSGLSQTYDGTAKGVTVTTSPSGLSGVSVSYTRNNAAVASPNAAGEYAVAASLTNDNYRAESVNATLVIARAEQAISFAALPSKTFGDAPFALSASASSSLPVGFQIVSGPATLSGNTLTLSGTGTVVVRASQPGDANHRAAPDVERAFSVSKGVATLTLGGLTQTYDGTARSVSVTTSPQGLGGVSVSYTLNGQPVAQPTAAGTYQAVASLSNSNYQAANASGTFVINKAAQAVSFAALPAKTFGDAPFALSASASSNLPVSFQLVSGPATLSGNTLTLDGVGTVVLRARQPGDSNFNAAPDVERSFNVEKARATLTLGDLSQIYNGSTRSASVNTNPAGLKGVAVRYSRNGVPVATPESAGSYDVVASLTNDNYQAQSVTGTLVIAKAGQGINFAPPPDRTFGDAPLALAATASSGLPVSFASAAGPATVNGGTVNVNGAGTVTVRASQPGDANFNAAPDVERSFIVARAATTTAVTSSSGRTALGQSVTFVAAVASGSGVPTGAVQFRAGDKDIGGPVNLNGGGTATLNFSDLPVGTHQIAAVYKGDANFASGLGALPGGHEVLRHVVQFSRLAYGVKEGDGQVSVTVTRAGDLSAAAAVDYATSDETARDRADYNRAVGSLSFAAGETEKSFTVLVNQDSYAEGAETLSVTLSGPTDGAVLGPRAVATLEIADDVPESAGNPNDDAEEFVRQHYRDFLSREADAGGLAFWTKEITSCGADEQCRAVKRENVSAAFFLSIEFKETGFLVLRLHDAAFDTGRAVRFDDFLRDTQEVGRGVVVGRPGWESRLEANREAFALSFVSRQAFLDLYPASMSPPEFVAALNANTGASLGQERAEELAVELASAGNTTQARASALRKVAENEEYVRGEFNRAFVLMQYFGYMRRAPNSSPDTGFGGYEFWLKKLEDNGGNFVQAQMVRAFIDSIEYRQRFGQ